jgi:hypothetical protein
MRIRKALAIGGTAIALAGTAVMPAAAANHHPASKGTFKSTVSPNPVHIGQTLTLSAHGAVKGDSYICTLVVIKGSNYVLGPGAGTHTPNKHGNFKCSVTFKKFSGIPVKGGSKVRHCPTTKADRKAGFKCGFAASTITKTSNTISYFVGKK